MTIDHQKEQLSNGFLGILAANRGYMVEKPGQDYGIDFTLKKTSTYILNGKARYIADSRIIDIQLKATTESQIIPYAGGIKYDFEVKNYNDIIYRRTNNGLSPLILILVVLPDNQTDWVDIDPTELRLRRNAFWFNAPGITAPTTNTRTIRIDIPSANLLGLDFCNDIHKYFYP